MSQWGLDEEDEYDFDLASEGTSGIGETSEQAAVEIDGGDWDPADAVSHPSGAVHLWFEDRQVRHARVSNRWRERVKDDSLEVVVADVLQRGQGPQVGWAPTIPDLDEPFLRSSLSDVLESFVERTLDLDDKARRMAELPDDEVRRTHHEGAEVEGLSRNRAVRVLLTIHGTTKELSLEGEWLEKARAEDIGAAIVEAHADAYARHTPPTVELGDHARLAQERHQLTTEILAALAR
ncbi:MAG: hypothetical protein ACTH2Q_14375 [Propionibacteriaceae bacterium]